MTETTMPGKTPGQAACEAYDALVFVPDAPRPYWDRIGEEHRKAWEAAGRAAIAEGAGAEMREMRHLNSWQGSEIGRLRDLAVRIRSALRDAPTAFIARREALELVNAADLDGVLSDPAPLTPDGTAPQ